jgi:hypothetical protein
MLATRERLRSRFLRCVQQLAQHWESAGRWDKAATLYERGLEADNLAEELYRRLMLCHRACGCRAEALEVYRRCRHTLSVSSRDRAFKRNAGGVPKPVGKLARGFLHLPFTSLRVRGCRHLVQALGWTRFGSPFTRRRGTRWSLPASCFHSSPCRQSGGNCF